MVADGIEHLHSSVKCVNLLARSATVCVSAASAWVAHDLAVREQRSAEASVVTGSSGHGSV